VVNMASIKGLESMGQLARNLERLAAVPSQASADVAATIDNLIDDQFDRGTDPYGKPWAPLAPSTVRQGRRPPPGTDTRELRDSVSVRPLPGAGVGITIGADYAEHFDRKRPILPRGTLPRTWNDAIQAAVDAAAERALGG